MYRDTIFQYVKKQYGTIPEYLWNDLPDSAILRNDLSLIHIFQRTRIYYCNPSAPYQKAEIEVGHEFIRRILPKGRSFDELTQADVEPVSYTHLVNAQMLHFSTFSLKLDAS